MKVPPGALEHEAREVGALLGRRRDVACLGLLGHLAKDKGQRRRPNEEGYCATPPLVCDTLTSTAEATKKKKLLLVVTLLRRLLTYKTLKKQIEK